MATRTHIRCTACGSLRGPEAFGIDDEGRFHEEELPQHEAQLVIQEIGGRGKCSWDKHPLPMPLAQALLACLRGAVERLEREIADAGPD